MGWLEVLIHYAVTPMYLSGYGVVFWAHTPQSSPRDKRRENWAQRKGEAEGGQDVQTRSFSSKVDAEGDDERTFIGGLRFCWLTYVVWFDFQTKIVGFLEAVSISSWTVYVGVSHYHRVKLL